MSQLPSHMRVSVLVGPRTLVVEERPVPEPDSDQVLVQVSSVGVCGSDVHFWHDGRLGDWVVTEPLVLGHESAGMIVAVGSGVSPERIGERVSVEPQRPVPTSRETRSGRYNLDPGMRFYATPGVDGAFAEYVAIQSHFAWRVTDNLSNDASALLEPLSVAIATAQKGAITVGSRVLVAGAGPVGNLTAQVARAYGASEVIVTDVSQGRRQRALDLGADRVVDPADVAVEELDLDVDVFVDASGAAAAIRSGIHCVRPGGAVVLVGMGASDLVLPVSVIQNRELALTGVFRYANTWPLAIELATSGRVDLCSLVTGHYGLDRVEDALRSTHEDGVMKSVVTPGIRS